MTLSVVIITHNEEANIGRTLESVKALVADGKGEIIVVDSGSTDRTVEIAKPYGAKVFVEEWKGFAAQKNSAIDKATGDWILSLDADEEVSQGMRAFLSLALFGSRAEEFAKVQGGVLFGRRNYFLGRWIQHGGYYPDIKLRLFRPGNGRFEDRLVHEDIQLEPGRERFYPSPVHGNGEPIDILHHSYPTLSDYIEHMITNESDVAAIILEPVVGTNGVLVPPPEYFPRLREICDRHGVLLVSDEVICAFGRLGHWFGALRYGYQPDIITVAKGLTSGYSPLGAMIASDRLMEPFLGPGASFLHGFTFAGHPVSCAVAMANLDVFEGERINDHVLANEGAFRSALEGLYDLPIVGDVRGAGFFWGIELVKDKETRLSFDDEESERLLRGFLSGALFDAGLICRADDRGDPVVQLSPPLICGQEEIDFMASTLREVLGEAWRRM